MFGSLIGGLFNMGSSLINSFNQRKANEELQEFQKEEADLAYKRSKPINQVANLVDAGLTDQQARQVVAGAAAPGQYTAAPGVNQMEGVDFGSALSSFAPFAQQLSELGTSSLQSPTGGALGSIVTEDVTRIITEHLNELPLSATTSLSGFLKYARSANAPDWLKSEDFQSAWSKAAHRSYGIRALQDFFKNSTSLEIGSKEAESKVLQVKSQTLANILANIKIDDETINYQRNNLRWIYDQETIPAASTVDLQMFSNQLEKAVLDSQFLLDPDYRSAYVSSMITSQQNQVLLAQVLKLMTQPQIDYLSDPNNAYFHSILSVFQQSGLTSTELGTIVATAEAGGVPVIKTLRNLVDDIVPEDPLETVRSVVDKGRETASQIVDGIESAADKATEVASEAANQTGIFLGKLTDKYLSLHDQGYSALCLPNDALIYTLSGGSEKYSERLKRHYENVVKPSLNYKRRQQRRK